MKMFTYNNNTTGRTNETIHAESKEEVLKIMGEMGYSVEITDVFDPDAFLSGDNNIDDIQNVNHQIIQPTFINEPTFFETDGISFKMENGKLFKKDWVLIENKEEYKILKNTPKNGKVKQIDLTDGVSLYINEWVEVDKK
jgi:hypothetical protein